MAVINREKKAVGNKREQILQAAVELFLEKDYYQVTIIEIAERAEVGKGTVYEYFPSKEALFKDMFSCCAETYLDSFKHYSTKSVSVKDKMYEIIKLHLDFIRNNRRKLYLLFNERPLSFQELQNWVLERRQELLQGVMDLIREGVRLKEFRDDIDIEIAGRVFLALNYAVVGGMIILDEVDATEEHVTNVLDLYWNGIASQMVEKKN